MNAISDLPPFLFARWDADDALDALHQAGLNIDHPLLARQPVLGLGFAFNFAGEVDPAQRTVVIEAATLRRGWSISSGDSTSWAARPALSTSSSSQSKSAPTRRARRLPRPWQT